MPQSQEPLLQAINDLRQEWKQFTTAEFDRLFQSQENRFSHVEEQLTRQETHLNRLNEKVTEHERWFIERSGVEKFKKRLRESQNGGIPDDSDDGPTPPSSTARRRRGSITADLSVRDFLWLLIACGAIATGNWRTIWEWVAK